MAVSLQKQERQNIWDGVSELTKSAQALSTDPLTWALQLSSNLTAAGLSLPSLEAAEFIVNHICWENNVPIMWKFLEIALSMNIVPPMLVIALLSVR